MGLLGPQTGGGVWFLFTSGPVLLEDVASGRDWTMWGAEIKVGGSLETSVWVRYEPLVANGYCDEGRDRKRYVVGVNLVSVSPGCGEG